MVKSFAPTFCASNGKAKSALRWAGWVYSGQEISSDLLKISPALIPNTDCITQNRLETASAK
jgi:hypothetical protein